MSKVEQESMGTLLAGLDRRLRAVETTDINPDPGLLVAGDTSPNPDSLFPDGR